MSEILISGVEMPSNCFACEYEHLIQDCPCRIGICSASEYKDGRHPDCPIVEVYDIGKLTIPAEEGAWEQGGRIYSTYKPISMKFPKWKAISPDTFVGV